MSCATGRELETPRCHQYLSTLQWQETDQVWDTQRVSQENMGSLVAEVAQPCCFWNPITHLANQRNSFTTPTGNRFNVWILRLDYKHYHKAEMKVLQAERNEARPVLPWPVKQGDEALGLQSVRSQGQKGAPQPACPTSCTQRLFASPRLSRKINWIIVIISWGMLIIIQYRKIQWLPKDCLLWPK